MEQDHKIISDYEGLRKFSESIRRSGLKISFVAGIFDQSDEVWERRLSRAKDVESEHVLIVAVYSDALAKKHSGKEPSKHEDKRASMLADFPFVSCVCIIKEETDETRIIEVLKPEVVIIYKIPPINGINEKQSEIVD